MGTEVLRPHNCLIEHIRVPPAAVFPRRRSFYNNNNNYHYHNHRARPSRSKAAPVPVRSDQKRKASVSSPLIARRYSAGDLRHSKHSHHHQFVRRGEQAVKMSVGYNSNQIRTKDSKTGNRSRSLSPKPVPNGTADVYAGSAIFVSPSPESLPLPSFSKRKQVDDSATRDLRRLLRID